MCGKTIPANSQKCPKCGVDPDLTLEDAKDMRKRLNELLQPRARNQDTSVLKDPIEKLLETQDIEANVDKLREIKSGELQFDGRLILTDEATGIQFVVPSDQLQEAIIGRGTDATGFKPTIDLSSVNGQMQGVSRRHATIQLRADVLIIIDHSSKNGTFVNEIRVAPGRARIIRNGDIIRIGNINLKVHFERVD
jgi:predicted DNA-binding protein